MCFCPLHVSYLSLTHTHTFSYLTFHPDPSRCKSLGFGPVGACLPVDPALQRTATACGEGGPGGRPTMSSLLHTHTVSPCLPPSALVFLRRNLTPKLACQLSILPGSQPCLLLYLETESAQSICAGVSSPLSLSLSLSN